MQKGFALCESNFISRKELKYRMIGRARQDKVLTNHKILTNTFGQYT